MIVNYYASTKTRAPFCGLKCCGNSFGAFSHNANRHVGVPAKRRMRRYARHAERRLIRQEVEMELALLNVWDFNPITDEQDDYYHNQFLLDMDENDEWYSDRDDRYSVAGYDFYCPVCGADTANPCGCIEN